MKKCIIAMLLFVITSPLAAQQVFTEDELITVVKQMHPVSKQAGLHIRIADANITASRGAFDPVLSIGRSRKELDGTAYYDHSITEVKIPTWYGVDIYAGSENINGSRLNPESTTGQMQFAGVSMSLLQNLLMDKRRASLQQAKILQAQSVVEQRIVLNELMSDALQSYWNWWGQSQMYNMMRAYVANAEKRMQLVRTGFRLGEYPAIDTLEAYTQWQQFRVRENEAYIALVKSQLELSLFLWTDKGTPYELPMHVVPQKEFKTEDFPLEALLAASNHHPELVGYIYKLRSLEIDKQLSLQSLLPDLNVKYNQMGRAFSNTVSSPWFQHNYRFGVSVSVPLRLSEGRGGYQAAKLKIQQAQLGRNYKQAEISNKVKQAFVEWQQQQKQLSLQGSLLHSFTALQKGEETRFINGESSLFVVNARELKTIESQQKLIELQVKNRYSLIVMKEAAGILAN